MSTSIVFWGIALLLTAAALGFVLHGLLRGGGYRRTAVVWVLAAALSEA